MRVTALLLAVVMSAALPPAAATQRYPLGLDLYRPVPADNPLTPAKIALGRDLFRDRSLSRDGSMSCSSCHDPRRSFTDGRKQARGLHGAALARNTPTLVNRVWGASFFWDGRAATLEQQALQPILNPAELAMTADAVTALGRSARYRSRFERAFGRPATLEDVARALASYVRTIVSGDTPYDRYLEGDAVALSTTLRHGLDVFRGKGGCVACHLGPNFSDEEYHNTGVAWRSGALADIGRAEVTERIADRGAFKTPTLRELARTAPYMHDGALPTLDAVIDYYDAGGFDNPELDRAMQPRRFSMEEKRDLKAFLLSLTGRVTTDH